MTRLLPALALATLVTCGTAGLAAPCSTLDADTLTEGAVSTLMAQGWTSTPHDSAERIYSPTC